MTKKHEPTTFVSNGIFENLKCHSGRQWHIQEGVGGDYNPLHDFTYRIFFSM